MKKTLLAIFCIPALAAAASAQEEAPALWTDLAETRPLTSVQEAGGQVMEWETRDRRVQASLSFFGRASFPGNTDVTVDGLWYSDFFDVGLGLSVEADVISYVLPHWGIGGYFSYGWDHFNGQRLNFFNGDFADVGDLDMLTAIVGAKVVQRVSPFVVWEGRMGVGWAHYDRVTWSGVDTGTPFSGEELFKAINRGLFEIGGRIAVGDRHIQGDFGFGIRYIGPAARGKDVTSAIDPDVLITFMLELGLTIRF
jgi:hypothetical protein